MTNFGKRLKELRRARDITQEQAAEYLGVSPQAVSRWECGATSPDIYILPMLSEMLGVSLETLLGVNSEKIYREIRETVAECEADIDRGITAAPIAKLRGALHDHPQNDELLLCLMYALYAASEDRDFCREHDDEIISIAGRIQKYSARRDLCDEARRILFRHFCDTDRRDEAIRLAEDMSMMETCFERNMYWALEGEDRVLFLKKRISEDLKYLLWDISAYSTHVDLSDEERQKCSEVCRNIEESAGSVPML